MFVEKTREPFGDNRTFMYRIRIAPLSDETAELVNPVPFDCLIGKLDKIRNRYALVGRSVISITMDEFRLICSLAEVKLHR
jgi:hypothetical protein